MKIKKNIYIIAVIVLLTELSILLYSLMLLVKLDKYAELLVIIILIIIGGYNLGQRWWNYVYIQKKHSNKWIDKLIKARK